MPEPTAAPEGVTREFTLTSWRLLERVLGLTNRLGCGLTRIDSTADGAGHRAALTFTGSPDALRRLDLQLTRLLGDDKEISR